MKNSQLDSVVGNVTRIQRFSTQDGPGIRTTVFLKGCTLACKWCHNPETITNRAELMWFKEKCVHCGACTMVCPTGAHVMNAESNRHEFLRERCVACGLCVAACVYEALEISLKRMSAREVMNTVLTDLAYYRNSGGGLTLSGGEPLVQPAFCGALLKGARDVGIHTAVDTALNVAWERVEPLLDLVDLWLVDLKVIDPQIHRQYTGTSNSQILENIRKLCDPDRRLVLRIPIIPGVNSGQDSMEKTAEFVGTLAGLEHVELLPYHSMGVDKAVAAGCQDYLMHFDVPERSVLEDWATHISARAVSVQLMGDPI